MITLDANLSAAMAKYKGGGIVARLHYTDTGGTARTPAILEYEFDRLTCRITIPYISTQQASENAALVIRRGLNVGGTEYTVDSHTFYVDKTFIHVQRGEYVIIGSVLPKLPVALMNTDRAASLVLADLFDQMGITPIFTADDDIWYTWQFYPLNKAVSLANGRNLLALISRKYLSDILPRSDGLHFGHRGTWAGGDTIADYTPELNARSAPLKTETLYASWEIETQVRTYIGDSSDPAHFFGFIHSDVDTADIQSLATMYYGGDEFEQRPDLSLENGDTLTPPAGSDYLGSACIEIEESYLRRSGTPRWLQVIRSINNEVRGGVGAGSETAGAGKSTVYIRQPIYYTRNVYVGDRPSGDDSYNPDTASAAADRMSGDEATFAERFIPYAYEVYHFNEQHLDFQWANAPFATPQFSHDISSSCIVCVSPNANKYFCWLPFDSSKLTCFLLGAMNAISSSQEMGLRVDDGTDDNYLEVFVNGVNALKARYRTGGGAVTTETSAYTKQFNDAAILVLRLSAASNFRFLFYLTSVFSIPKPNLQYLFSGYKPTALPLNFTVQRVGFFGAGSTSIVVDAFGFMDVQQAHPDFYYALIGHDNALLKGHDGIVLQGYEVEY